LCHARKDPDHADLTLQCDEHKQRITLTASTAWANDFPQSAHLLKQETLSWQKASWAFEFVTNP
jgi:exopolyphosphatase/guanosine-5'-triphosphate,3'-diphosphate pyrophosphatase